MQRGFTQGTRLFNALTDKALIASQASGFHIAAMCHKRAKPQKSEKSHEEAPRHTLHDKGSKGKSDELFNKNEKPQTKAWKEKSKVEGDVKKDQDIHQNKGMSEKMKEEANNKGKRNQ